MMHPRKGILWLAASSRFLILSCFVMIALFMCAMHVNKETKVPYSTPKQCKTESIKDIPSMLGKELRAINCSTKKAIHSLESSRNSLVATIWPSIPLIALLLTTSVFLFNIAVNTYKHLRYLTYYITTQKYRYKVSGSVRITNQNEVSEHLIKAYFFDYSGKRCCVSEIPFPHKNGNEASILAAGESVELTLLPSQAEVARATPKKIDIVLSAVSGKITCVKGKEYWKPKQISQR
ncbi:hypothetical protein BCV29_11615 [Vibrio cyclitrophicus]|uniref:hypothetical protein n=1 Tax=Vibrio cyclitrophicus TaxID=47951 RepID=UPI000C81B93C|nr:hypothetical protein [Vibrio cyclitrophicus]PME76911.1 hypothetical protein BCV29_14600 [Vibrio cyclitrophicus]